MRAIEELKVQEQLLADLRASSDSAAATRADALISGHTFLPPPR